MTQRANDRPAMPDGYITKREAAQLVDRSPKTVERLCAASQKSPHKVRWTRVANRGTRSITVYHKEDLLQFLEYRVQEFAATQDAPTGPSLILEVDETIRALIGLARVEVERGTEGIRVELHSARGHHNVRVSLELTKAG